MGNFLRTFKLYQSRAYGAGVYGSGPYGVGEFVDIKVAPGWSINSKLNARSTFSGVIVDLSTATLSVGKDFKLYDNDGNLLFAGIIQTIEDYEQDPGFLYHQINVVDYAIICDRRRAVEVYENTTAGAIINDLITNYLSEEGITAGTIETGPDITKLTSNYWAITQILDWIKTNTGYTWNIDENKQLNFISQTSNKSSIQITDTSKIRGLKRHRELGNYRNIQYVRGGFRRTSTQTNEELTPAPDGTSKQFISEFKIAEEPSIEIDTGSGYTPVSSADVGVLGLDTGKKWYWSYNSDKITQDKAETVLASGNKIRLSSYIGLTRLFMIVENPTEISNRQSIEGGSGKYEDVVIDKTLDTIDQAEDFGNGLLDTYGDIKDNLTFIVDDDIIGSFKVGELVKINRTLYNIDEWFLIDSIQIRGALSGTDPLNIERSIKCLDGASVGGWEEWFKTITNANKEIELTNDEDIIEFINSSDTYAHQGTYEIEIIEELYPLDTLYPSDTLTPGSITNTEVILD